MFGPRWMIVGMVLGTLVGNSWPAEPEKGLTSAGALAQLERDLAESKGSLLPLADKPYAKVPLTKTDAAQARNKIWTARLEYLRKDRAAEVKARELKIGGLTMPFAFKTFGDKPSSGRSLWISLHGGGGAPARVNDSQYENQKKLYQPPEGIYLAPRAPTNTWNLWHEGHIDDFFARLVEDLVALEGVNPDRVYLMGYSAGGDGVYQMAPRMADWWAGAAMMAGHPNGVSLLSLRNVPFALQVGAKDTAYNRSKVAAEYGEQLDKLKKGDPGGYEHFVRIHEGMGHWMNLKDKEALPWLAGFSRNPVPTRIVWKQTGRPHDRSYWLAVPKGQAKIGSLVVAERKGNRFTIEETDQVDRLLLRVDDRTVSLDEPIEVEHKGKVLYKGKVERTIATLIQTLEDRNDPQLMFDSEIALDLKKQP